jgi:hypothetical protein
MYDSCSMHIPFSTTHIIPNKQTKKRFINANSKTYSRTSARHNDTRNTSAIGSWAACADAPGFGYKKLCNGFPGMSVITIESSGIDGTMPRI